MTDPSEEASRPTVIVVQPSGRFSSDSVPAEARTKAEPKIRKDRNRIAFFIRFFGCFMAGLLPGIVSFSDLRACFECSGD